MKGIAAICLCALVFQGQALLLQDSVSPITRVVKLLQDLSKQVEKDGKAEEDLYESFVCWGKSMIAQKTDSNSAAKSRSDSLTTYIADLTSGKVELTTESKDLEKEIVALTKDAEAAKTLRDKEHGDFKSAEKEMKQAKTALSSAMQVLSEATKPKSKTAKLMAFKSELNGGLAAMEAESASLNQAVKLGEQFLSKADSLFLRRLLTGEVRQLPVRDQKKLGKKADFKMKYQARSSNIQKTLTNLLETFTENLKQAQDKEKAVQSSYESLHTAKGAQLTAAQEALTKQDVENGARGVAKKNAEGEVAALKNQVAEDEKLMSQTETSLTEKKKEWGDRSTLRQGELSAISKAISILGSGDARDNFKKSYSSQGSLLLQSSSSEATTALGQAAKELKSIAQQTGDSHLSAIAALAVEVAANHQKLVAANMGPSATVSFKPVIAAVDKMIGLLEADEKKDLQTKETCEKDRMEDTRNAMQTSKDIDEQTADIAKAQGEISDISGAVETLEASSKKAKEELDAAGMLREKEAANFAATNKEDQEAAATVKSATAVLSKYYQDNAKAALVVKKQPTVEKAPATWEGGYGGKQSESAGIIGILEMVHSDILKDQSAAAAEEKKSQKEFETYKTKTEDQMKELKSQIDKQNGIKGSTQVSVSETTQDRATKKGLLGVVLQKMKDANPGCEYFTTNYKLRVSNRQIEKDGLRKAKAILNGGSFN